MASLDPNGRPLYAACGTPMQLDEGPLKNADSQWA